MSVTVQSIQFLPKFKESKNSNLNRAEVTCPNMSRVQNNNLTDANYGVLLAKKVSFKGTEATMFSSELSSKVSAVLSKLKQNEIILVGRDFGSTKELLKKRIASIPTAIKKIFFVADNEIENSVAVFRNDEGLREVVNINDVPVGMKDSTGSFYQLNPGSSIYFTPGDRVFTRGGHISYMDSSDVPESFKAVKAFNEFDFSGQAKANMADLNLRTLKVFDQKTAAAESKKITFANVGGQDATINALKKNILFPIKYPSAFPEKNHGVILTGPPGTGKSLIAEALANHSDAHYTKLNGLELTQMWVGKTEENWRKLFADAREHQPSVIFIDEFDAVAKARQGSSTSANDDKIVDQLLTIMSDLEKDDAQVYVIAATNRPEMLDSAITRSGRFGVSLPVDKPDLEGCKKILQIHTKNKPISEKLDREALSVQLHKIGAVGADIAEIVRRAKENAYNRLGFFTKMDEGTFSDVDLLNFKIEPVDFKLALSSFKSEQIVKAGGEESHMGFHRVQQAEVKVEDFVLPPHQEQQIAARANC